MECFAPTPDGKLLIGNGIDRWLIWDGLSTQAIPAGITAPTTGPTIAGSGAGSISGTYTAYVRFLDADGNVSDFSPISNSVDVDDVAQIDYTNVPVPTEERVTRRQILRNTDDQVDTYYVDIDTTDLSSTTFSSTKPDSTVTEQASALFYMQINGERVRVRRVNGQWVPIGDATIQPDEETLDTQEAVPLFDDLGNLNANRYGVPPSWKSVMAYHSGRMFAAVDEEYTQGHVKLTLGSRTVTGVGTEWPEDTFVGRFLFVQGAEKPYEIDSLNPTTQVITLLDPYEGQTDNFGVYSIRPAPAERRLIYWSESGLPEAWPAFNAIELQEDGDDITGLMPKGSYIFIVEKRHIYRFTFQSNPATDGMVFLASNRGCINNRCWVLVEDVAYMLDQNGIHAFGLEDQPVSTTVSELFRNGRSGLRVNWRASRYFHAVHFPGQEVIRWYVAMAADYLPRHAIAFCYRTERWWIEEYAFPIGASCLGLLDGDAQVYLGSAFRKIFAFWKGVLDGADEWAGTVRGAVTSSDAVSLTDSAATFATSGLVNSPISLIDGKGKGQTRVIVSVSSGRIVVDQPWTTIPDTTTTYQIGAVRWRYRPARFQWMPGEQNNPRRVRVMFQPVDEDATFDLRVYEDYNADPLEWGVDRTSAQGNGVRMDEGEPDAVCDLTKSLGHIQIQMDGMREGNADGNRYVGIELQGYPNRDEIAFDEIVIEGAA